MSFLRSAVWRVLLTCLATCAAIALPAATSDAAGSAAAGDALRAPFAAAAPATRQIPNPIAADEYLAEQRAGYGNGNPVRAARLAARADTVANRLRGAVRPSANESVPAVAPNATGPNLAQEWQPLGPSPVVDSYYGHNNSGRIDSVAVAPSGKIYIGSAGGGVWSSSNDGEKWVTHTDHASSGLAIGALALDPQNEEIVYAGTGEANNCGDCFYGGGVLKSTDSGESWTVENPNGIFSGVDFASLAVNPENPEVLYAGTTKGFYVSEDGGEEWSQPSAANGYVNGATWGLAIDPNTSPVTLYIATSGVGIQKSTDGGEHFTTLTEGLPGKKKFGVTQLGIGTKTATNPTGSETLYAAVQLQPEEEPGPNGGDIAIYKTTDAGAKWHELTKVPAYTAPGYAYEGEEHPISDAGDQASYDNAIAVDPEDPEHVIAGGIAAIESKDGGESWTSINGGDFAPTTKEARENAIHPDFHAIAFASETGDGVSKGEALLGCDGGIYRYDPKANGGLGGPTGVANLNEEGSGLDISQFYEGLSVYEDGSKILGGVQDNGTPYLAAPGAGPQPWKDVLVGDGGYAAINPLDPQQQFGEADQHLAETVNGWRSGEPEELEIGPEAEGNFSSPFALVPNSASGAAPSVFYGGRELWVTRSIEGRATKWAEILRARHSETNAGQPNNVSAIAVAPSNPEVMYVGFNDGELFVTTNGGATTPTFTGLADGVEQWITHISVSPTDPGSIALSYSQSNDQTSAQPPMVQTGEVTLTRTPRATFANITGHLPQGVASNSVVFDHGAFVVATDVGVFSTTAPNGEATVWTAVGSALPNVQVLGLTVDQDGNLYAATHGRGLWKLTVPPVPKNTALPSISGTTRVGETLTAQAGTWEDSPTSFTYRWLRCDEAGISCTGIAGATADTYPLVAEDAGHTLRVEVTAESADGQTAADSAPSAVVAPAPAKSPPSAGGASSATTPTGASTSSSTTTAPTTKAPATGTAATTSATRGFAVAARVSKVVDNRAQVALRCRGAGACSGRVRLEATIVERVRKGRRYVRRKRLVTIGSASFTIAARAHEKLTVHLSGRGAHLLRKARERVLKAKLNGSGVKRRAIVLELVPPRHARHPHRKRRR